MAVEMAGEPLKEDVMRRLSNAEMGSIEGEGFWGGFACGVSILLAMAEGGLNPAADLLAIGTCGWVLEG